MNIHIATALCAILAGSSVATAQQATAPPAPQAQPQPGRILPWTLTPSQNGVPLPTQGFSVVLVLGDLQGGSTPDNVPPAAKKALADMKDFLPYHSYRLLDAEWILGSNSVVTRLRGLDDQEYALNMTASAARDNSKAMYVEFLLREAGMKTATTSMTEAREKRVTELAMDRAKLERQVEVLREKLAENHSDAARTQAEMDAVKKQLAELDAKLSGSVNAGVAGGVSGGVGIGVGRGVGVATPRAGSSIISTSFTMDPGETVVVGTSRLGGDKALIALLTAVPRGKTTAKD